MFTPKPPAEVGTVIRVNIRKKNTTSGRKKIFSGEGEWLQNKIYTPV